LEKKVIVGRKKTKKRVVKRVVRRGGKWDPFHLEREKKGNANSWDR